MTRRILDSGSLVVVQPVFVSRNGNSHGGGLAAVSLDKPKRSPSPAVTKRIHSTNLVSLGSWAQRALGLPSLRTAGRFQISCAAKPETLDKVVQIVKKQLALPEDSQLTPSTTFSELGADSLDTVEIVMGLEGEFDISVEEESSDSITTVQEAADMIEKLVQKKAEA